MIVKTMPYGNGNSRNVNRFMQLIALTMRQAWIPLDKKYSKKGPLWVSIMKSYRWLEDGMSKLHWRVKPSNMALHRLFDRFNGNHHYAKP
jgi:hypothetical protein